MIHAPVVRQRPATGREAPVLTLASHAGLLDGIVSEPDLGDVGEAARTPSRARPRARMYLLILWVGVFGGSAAVMWIASRSAAGRGSCGPNCYTDVYIGPGLAIAILVVAMALATLTVALVARRRRTRQ
jgi:hypothetical protein